MRSMLGTLFCLFPTIFVLIDTPAAVCAKRMVERAEQQGEPLELFEVEGSVSGSCLHIVTYVTWEFCQRDGRWYRNSQDIHQRILKEILPIIERE
jgi:hypothetical protein